MVARDVHLRRRQMGHMPSGGSRYSATTGGTKARWALVLEGRH